eukprot:scaffold95305_cov30-Tisochrysis_lutea.AAC.2
MVGSEKLHCKPVEMGRCLALMERTGLRLWGGSGCAGCTGPQRKFSRLPPEAPGGSFPPVNFGCRVSADWCLARSCVGVVVFGAGCGYVLGESLCESECFCYEVK